MLIAAASRRCLQPSGRISSSFQQRLHVLISSRQALRYLIRNTTLPQRVRARAQLELSQMHCYTRPTQLRNRCVEGGKARGVFREFRMARVSAVRTGLLPRRIDCHTQIYRTDAGPRGCSTLFE